MKKEFKDLTVDEKKEYLFLEALSLDLPYVIPITAFSIVTIITTNAFVGFGSIAILFILAIGYIKDRKKFKEVCGLN